MSKPVLYIALVVLAVAAATLSVLHFKRARVAVQLAVKPGDLSKSHAFLGNNCAACHTPVKGVEAANCIVCHANNQALSQRQPTAFHANIRSCKECHVEHRGRDERPITMDHAALTRIALRQVENQSSESRTQATQIKSWLQQTNRAALSSPNLKKEEAVLNCATCHATKDRHSGLFGTDCAACHGTTAWTIPEFRHPSSASQSCAQCHQAPPSHYMEHFHMVSMKVAGQEHADVGQCFLCHQTTSWNDIKGVGFYKHH